MTNSEFAAGLRQLADVYEAHPEMYQPEHLDLYLFCGREQFAASVKAIGTCKKQPASRDDYFFTVERKFGELPIQLHTPRSNVCRKVRVMKEVEDWDCSDPILESLVSEVTA